MKKRDGCESMLMFTQNIYKKSTSNQFPSLNSCHLMCVMGVFYYIHDCRLQTENVNQSNETSDGKFLNKFQSALEAILKLIEFSIRFNKNSSYSRVSYSRI